MLRFDKFGESVNFSYSEESPVYRSAAGAMASCIIGFFTLVFTISSIQVLRQYDGTLFTSTVMKDENEDLVFTREDGFMMAFAIIDQRMPDGSDKAGRSLDEYLNVQVV